MRVQYNSRKRKKKVLKRAKGFRGQRHSAFKSANEAVLLAMRDEFIGRKLRKRDFRKLWITRISAFVKAEGITYSRFIHGLNKAGVEINRKVLANLAVEDPDAMKEYVKIAKAQLA